MIFKRLAGIPNVTLLVRPMVHYSESVIFIKELLCQVSSRFFKCAIFTPKYERI